MSSRQRNAAGIVTRFAYDARHRVTAIDHPIGGDEGFAYNGEGELTAHTDRAGQRIEIGRDGLGRITERRYGAAQSGEVDLPGEFSDQVKVEGMAPHTSEEPRRKFGFR